MGFLTCRSNVVKLLTLPTCRSELHSMMLSYCQAWYVDDVLHTSSNLQEKKLPAVALDLQTSNICCCCGPGTHPISDL